MRTCDICGVTSVTVEIGEYNYTGTVNLGTVGMGQMEKDFCGPCKDKYETVLYQRLETAVCFEEVKTEINRDLTRKDKEAKYWKWVGHSPASDEFEEAINMPLRMLTDEQLDQLLAEITAAGGFGDDEDESKDD